MNALHAFANRTFLPLPGVCIFRAHHASPVAYTPNLDGGSPNIEENSMLATAVRRAKDAGVPKENIENALLKARAQAHRLLSRLTESYRRPKARMTMGKLSLTKPCCMALWASSCTCLPQLFDGFVAELAGRECRTNNINRTVSNVRETLNRYGSVQPLFFFHYYISSIPSQCSTGSSQVHVPSARIPQNCSRPKRHRRPVQHSRVDQVCL